VSNLYTVSAEEGAKIPTIKMFLKKGNLILGQFILIPHSEHLYELHMSNIDKSLKGQMKGICEEGLKFIFNDMVKLEKLMVMIPTNNRLAIRLAKSVMSYEGTLKHSFLLNSVMIDQDIYGITREEVKCL